MYVYKSVCEGEGCRSSLPFAMFWMNKNKNKQQMELHPNLNIVVKKKTS